MDGSNANPTDRPDNPEWYFLSEFSISEFLSDHDRSDALTAGIMFQTMRELGMSLEWVENIEMTLAGFANEAMAHFKQGRLEISGRIRIFCQKKIFDDASSTWSTSRPYQAAQAAEHSQIVLNSGMKRMMDGDIS